MNSEAKTAMQIGEIIRRAADEFGAGGDRTEVEACSEQELARHKAGDAAFGRRYLRSVLNNIERNGPPKPAPELTEDEREKVNTFLGGVR